MNLDNFKLNRSQFFILYLFLTFWLFARQNLNFSVNYFKYTHYLFNYEYEFIKRGFVGEILSFFYGFGSINHDVVNYLSLVSLIILSLFFFHFFVGSLNKKNDISKLIFSVMVFTSPLTTQHFIYDLGRFDIINFVITFLCFFIIEKFYKKNLLVFILIGLSISIMILIHEASFFMFVFPIFAFWFFKNSYKSSIIVQIILLSFISFLTFIISTAGIAKALTPEAYYELLRTKEIYIGEWLIPNPYVSKYSIQILYGGLYEDFDQGIFKTLFADAINVGLSKWWLIHNFILIFSLLPLFYLVFVIFKDFFFKSKIQSKILLLSCFSPLGLFLFSYDHMRYWSLIFTNLFIIFFILYKENNFYKEILNTNIKRFKKLNIFLIILGLVLGPVGNYQSFGFAKRIIGNTLVEDVNKWHRIKIKD